ncbi:MAG: MFS transporter [candidate division WOR-3 bacterium]
MTAKSIGNRLGALSYKNFRLFWFGQIISLIGTWVQNVARSWLVLQLSNSPFILGLVAFIGSIPILIFSLLGGLFADRVYKRNLLLFTQTTLTILAFLLAGLVYLQLIRVWHILILEALAGMVFAFDAPGRQSFVKELVNKEDLMNAVALNSLIFNLARMIGPAVAGLLITTVGIAFCFLVNGLSFLPVIFGLIFIRTAFLPPEKSSYSKDLKDAFRYILKNREILLLILMVGFLSVFGVSFLTLVPVFARDILRVGVKGYGMMMSAVGFGSLSGASLLAILGKDLKKGKVIIIASFSFALFLLIFSFQKLFLPSLFLLFGLGLWVIMQNVTVNTILQEVVPDNLRGRVMSFYVMMFMGMFPVGSLLAGAVAQKFGAPVATAFGSIVILIWSLYVSLAKLLPQEI